MARNNKTRLFYVLYSVKTWDFDQSERAQCPIYIKKSNNLSSPQVSHIRSLQHKHVSWIQRSGSPGHLKYNFISNIMVKVKIKFLQSVQQQNHHLYNWQLNMTTIYALSFCLRQYFSPQSSSSQPCNSLFQANQGTNSTEKINTPDYLFSSLIQGARCESEVSTFVQTCIALAFMSDEPRTWNILLLSWSYVSSSEPARYPAPLPPCENLITVKHNRRARGWRNYVS